MNGGARGWVCPNCGTVNAPWKASCACSPVIKHTEVSTDFRDDPNRESQDEYFGRVISDDKRR